MTTLNPMVAALQRLNGREMLTNPDAADEFIGNLTRFATTDRAEAAALEVTSRENLCMTYGIDDRPEGDGRKQFVYQDGVAVIPVHGTLINRFNSSWGFVTGYNFLRRQLNLVLDDDDVEMFIFDMNSPGGEASGCFELAREVLASRRIKPSMCMVDSLMASGGTALGVPCTSVYAIPSARIGSIGVYRQHVSIEKALDSAGVKISFATAGKHKVDGNMYSDLPDSVMKDWTKDVGRTWDDFIELVAECRGMEEDAVRATEARIYRADEALDKGLIDKVKTTTEAVPAFVAEMAGDTPDDDEEDKAMTIEKKGSEATSGIDYEKIGAMMTSGIASAMTAVMSAQNRTTAIREHGKAKGQVALAAKLSANDKLTEAEAIEMIDAAAAAAPAPKGKGKAPKGKSNNRAAIDDGDDDDLDEDDDADADGDDGDNDNEDEDDEDGAEKARIRRQAPKDRVNHLDRAMKRGKGDRVGGGNGGSGGDGLTGDAAVTATLLGDYAAHTGTDLRPAKKA